MLTLTPSKKKEYNSGKELERKRGETRNLDALLQHMQNPQKCNVSTWSPPEGIYISQLHCTARNKKQTWCILNLPTGRLYTPSQMFSDHCYSLHAIEPPPGNFQQWGGRHHWDRAQGQGTEQDAEINSLLSLLTFWRILAQDMERAQ